MAIISQIFLHSKIQHPDEVEPNQQRYTEIPDSPQEENPNI